MLAVTALLVGCSDPSPTPTPTPTAGPALEPLAGEVIEVLLSECGATELEAPGDMSFDAEAGIIGDYPADSFIALDVTVGLDDEHEAQFGYNDIHVLDGDGALVAVTLARGHTEVSTADGSATAMVAFAIQPCDISETSLPDGDYQAIITGRVSPLDHVHAVQEYWQSERIPFTISGGDVSTS